MENHVIAIIVPCYNQGQFLDETLQSVIDQSFEGWECIIVNDGSTDNTEQIALQWCEKDKRFTYLKTLNNGLSAARNSGIRHAKTEFILPLDSDDIIAPNYISLALNEFRKEKSVKVVYSYAEKFGEEIGLLNLAPFNLFNLSRNSTMFCSSIYRKIDWEQVGGYDEKMFYGWEDWEFWIAILKNGGTVKRIDEVCFYYRIKQVSMLKSIDDLQGHYLLNYLSVKHADFFVNHYGSFKKMEKKLERNKQEYEDNLKSEKFVIDLFCSTFLGFSFFGKYRKNIS